MTASSISLSSSLFHHRSRTLWLPLAYITPNISSIRTPKSTRFSSIQTKMIQSTNFSTLSQSASAAASTNTSTEDAILPKPKPWLIAGLGNPGKKYHGTRHNVGFEMVDRIAVAEGISVNNASFKSLFGKGLIGGVPVILSKPQTFMNVSGESVGPMVSYYKIPLSQVLLIYDDMDLPFGKLRLFPKGGHGGHNGMRSIIDHFKGSDFPRLRIGIGRPPGKMDPVNFVLRPFSRQECDELEFMFKNGVEAVRILLLEGFNKSATFVNSAKSLEQLI